MYRKSYVLLMLIILCLFLFKATIEDTSQESVNADAKNTGESAIYASSKKIEGEGMEMQPLHSNIKVYKKERILELYTDGNLIGRFRIGLGRSPEGDKTREGDSKTPEGRYYICTRNARSKYTLFLGLSYPNTKDAAAGLKNGLISIEEYELIKAAEEKQQRPLWDTALGGEVGIHGGGSDSDWTRGCIAVSDEDIRIIWNNTTFKTPVEIYK